MTQDVGHELTDSESLSIQTSRHWFESAQRLRGCIKEVEQSKASGWRRVRKQLRVSVAQCLRRARAIEQEEQDRATWSTSKLMEAEERERQMYELDRTCPDFDESTRALALGLTLGRIALLREVQEGRLEQLLDGVAI